ncbi:MAG: type II secretion system protein [Microgenomates group bacterium]
MVKKQAFTLIELIIVIGLIAMLMLAISSALLMTIVSSNRIRTTTKTKQAGNFALDQIQGLIRNSKDLTICNSTTVTVVNQDGASTGIVLDNARILSGVSTYLTPSGTTASANVLFTCLPGDTPPLSNSPKTNLIKVSFDLKDESNARVTENPTLHFETSINLRNQ